MTNEIKKKQKRKRNKTETEENPDIIDHDIDYTNKPELDVSNKDHSEHDTDNEDKPKRKKKKKQIQVVTETGEKKGKKSIRQMKKEKFAQRQAEAAAVAKDHLKSQCITYLSQWKHDRQNWKFMKSKQVWLYKNKFNTNLIPDSSWSTLLEYFESAKGNIKVMLLNDANKVIEEMDQWTESAKKNENQDHDSDTESQQPDASTYKRARDLLQCLQE